jgi:hypothetical protein
LTILSLSFVSSYSPLHLLGAFTSCGFVSCVYSSLPLHLLGASSSCGVCLANPDLP